MVSETFNICSFFLLMFVTQALTVSPLTSISQAPQLPVKQPVGISKPAFSAVENQSSPSEAYVSILSVSYTHLRAHETYDHLVCRLLL